MKLLAFLAMAFLLTDNALAEAPKRIVSIGGANTEILYGLKVEDRLVGSDTTSYYPKAAQQTPKVGYMRALSAEGILSLKPDLVILAEQSGPPPVLAQLEQVGVKMLKIEEAHSIADVKANINLIAKTLDVLDQAKPVLEKIDKDVALLEKTIEQNPISPSLMYILQAGGGAPLAAGEQTAADHIIKLSGAKNAVLGYDGYKPLTPESAVKMKPDYILVSRHGQGGSSGVKQFKNAPGVHLTRAAQEGRVIEMDMLFLLGFGPRTAEAALKLRSLYSGQQS
ncbi:MAG: ABC transporter substrate-binding protein [Methylocystaceae bacterium]|nr:ABC transporter substrate-binding protein [Methylocystaceae bacterium]